MPDVGSAESYRGVSACRVCESGELEEILDLGETPLANSFVGPEQVDLPEPRFPLEALRCSRCGMVELSVVVRPELMFADYLYETSASAPMVVHFEALAEQLVERYAPRGSLVVEIGSNDGVLLRPLAARGAAVVGIEPAANLAARANAKGLETWPEFFGPDVARRLVSARGHAAVVTGNNVLAHIDDLREVLRGLDVLLAPEGVFVAEFPYLGDLIANVEYDTIYHEHLSYFALAPIETLFAQANLEVFDVECLPIHGGSLRIHVGRAGHRSLTVRLMDARDRELRAGLGEPATFRAFARSVEASRDALRSLLSAARRSGKRIGALGASAKGNTLLNYCGVGPEWVEFVADSTPAKQGRLTPGSRIPVRPERVLLEERPDLALLLAWNYVDEVLRRHSRYVDRGGRFIHPVPRARLIP